MIRRLGLACVLLLAASGCATGKSAVRAPVDVPVEAGAFDDVLRMSPLELRTSPRGMDRWTPAEFFTAGNDAYDEGDWRQAVALYDRLLRQAPDDDLAPPALFNAALALEQLGEFERAEAYFAGLLDRFDSHTLATNAAWNLLELRERREAWRDALRVVNRLRRVELAASEALELDAREAIARAVLQPDAAAVERLESLALEMGRRMRQGQVLSRTALARLYWTIGEIWLGRSQAVVIDPSGREQLEMQLEVKAEHLLRAQDGYMRTVRALDPYWATAAVFRIGFAYESFYADLVQAPAPKELDSTERSVYFDEVGRVLRPVKRKAEMAYERIIGFSRRYSVDTEWIRRAEEHLTRLRSLEVPGEAPEG